MPIYEYSCAKCGHAFEVLLRKAADTPQTCPKCGARKPVKALSAFAVGARDPSPRCQTCPTAASSCSAGQCASGGCPFSG